MPEQGKPAYDREYAQDFSGYYNKLKIFRLVDIQKKKLLAKYFSDKSEDYTLLDLGCGTGSITSSFAQNCTVIGIDQNPVLLKIAQKNGLKTIQSEISLIPLSENSVEAVFMGDVIEHIESRSAILSEVNRVLKKNGMLIIITPNYSSPLWNIAEKMANFLSGKDLSGHITPFTKEALFFWVDKYTKLSKIGCINFGMWLFAVGQKN
ncbi:MAG: hypothetical protein A2096_08920 [Spirochaetes bacterium GWF1_41_5]|nr:MAG: hypothetical protein A2096_08920 [Spirochaetes bacterium GWF1_41_5]